MWNIDADQYRKIFGFKGEEMTGGWPRLLNEDLYNSTFY
jgi:hypothetical protein